MFVILTPIMLVTDVIKAKLKYRQISKLRNRVIITDITRRIGTEFTKTAEVLSFINKDSCKLLYRSRRKKGLDTHEDRGDDRAKGSLLYILEYEKGNEYPTVIEYPAIPELKSFAPLFSHTGTKILYNQSFSATDLYILDLNTNELTKITKGASPHWFHEKNTGKTKIAFRTQNECFETVPQAGETYALEIDEHNNPVGPPEKISAYGWGGGISTNGRYLTTAYLFICSLDRQTDRISAPLGTEIEKVGPNSNQCCCCSIAPDDTGRMMMLRWLHNRFTMMEHDGNNQVDFEIPADIKEWQTPEWSTHPDFCTASGMNSEFIYDLFVIRISDKKYLRITQDGGYVHGHLWLPKD